MSSPQMMKVQMTIFRSSCLVTLQIFVASNEPPLDDVWGFHRLRLYDMPRKSPMVFFFCFHPSCGSVNTLWHVGWMRHSLGNVYVEFVCKQYFKPKKRGDLLLTHFKLEKDNTVTFLPFIAANNCQAWICFNPGNWVCNCYAWTKVILDVHE